jgi:hypothetical protein
MDAGMKKLVALAGALLATATPAHGACAAYWGVGPAQDLARGLRDALDRTGTRLGAG